HVMKYLGEGPPVPAGVVERELESFLEQLQPGWQAHVVAGRFLPGMTVAHALPRRRRLGVAEEGSPALLVVLERRSPVERAAYLLRRAFDYGYDEIAEALGKSEAACRQLVSRAEEHVRARRPRFEAEPGEAERITEAFLQACATGD